MLSLNPAKNQLHRLFGSFLVIISGILLAFGAQVWTSLQIPPRIMVSKCKLKRMIFYLLTLTCLCCFHGIGICL
jgi:hypothetical protein